MSSPTLETAYGLAGLSAFVSRIGTSSAVTWPYTSEELQMWIFGSIPTRRTASSRLVVPITLVCRVSAGARKLAETYDWAARWKIQSGRTVSSTRTSECRSRSSASWSCIRPSRPRTWSSGLRQRTSPCTSTPYWERSAKSARWLPTMPVMPVIRMRMIPPCRSSERSLEPLVDVRHGRIRGQRDAMVGATDREPRERVRESPQVRVVAILERLRRRAWRGHHAERHDRRLQIPRPMFADEPADLGGDPVGLPRRVRDHEAASACHALQDERTIRMRRGVEVDHLDLDSGRTRQMLRRPQGLEHHDGGGNDRHRVALAQAARADRAPVREPDVARSDPEPHVVQQPVLEHQDRAPMVCDHPGVRRQDRVGGG